jgi:Cdc6-like AAA superfamily ATPase
MSEQLGLPLALEAQRAVLRQIFRPSSPTEDPSLFQGRTEELSAVVGAVEDLGRHVVVYGERGVGKTSLAYMAKETFQAASGRLGLAVRIPCSSDDNFASIWQKLVPRLRREADLFSNDLQAALEGAIDKVEDIIDFAGDQVSPDTVARALHVLAARVPVLVVLDEFDRLGGEVGSAVLFSDLIKTLTDDLVKCTVIIVGVADDVDSLITGHRSIERALKQVYMPRMTRAELQDIVVRGFEAFEQRTGIRISIDPASVRAIARLSHGFPYFAHLLAGSVGDVALRAEKHAIGSTDVFEALFAAMSEATQAIRVSYTDAVSSPKASAQFDLTLLACALADTDELGFFAPVDVSRPLTQISNRARSTPSFLGHLKRFAGPPSWVLETRGEGRGTRYRFANPLMRPYVMMKGVRDQHLALPDHEEDN